MKLKQKFEVVLEKLKREEVLLTEKQKTQLFLSRSVWEG